ncbi:MAG: EAL domain-containing protein (putative c-di-GMP-specific phosphodiesterase class I)/serine/threonine protein kinase [Gammaproteobacteria bacterium]|jgi:EAL domain-containing protein (putative c-di-GMP-specific phosphodiesterase class I)/serine/threonine protein kinase/AmiR/NasT family two-component response regulator
MRFKTDEVLPPGFRLHWYQLQSVLGDGGFGITYLGRDTNLNQSVAIKEFFPRTVVRRDEDHKIVVQQDADPEFFQWGLDRFLDEARLLARFRHPNIVRVLSVFESLGTAYLVMELERGKSLAESISDGEFSQDRQVLDLCLPMMDGLEMVHDAGFIHRDIKPCNVLMRSGMGPVLIDFGSARQPRSGRSGELTAIVSRGYAPFEQYEAGNEHRQGPWTDIYGLGATLYHAVTGGAPMDALTRGMCLLNGDPDPFVPSAVSAPGRFSARLLNSVDRALDFKAGNRPQSIAEWRSMFPNHSARRSKSSQAVRTEALDKTADGESVVQRLRLAARPVDARWSARDTSNDRASATATAQNSTTERNTAVVGAGFRDLRILLVDDDRAARTLTKRVLSNLGAECIDTVESAGEALARLEDASCVPELLISDLEMPNMDGVQLLRHLAQRQFRAPLLLMGDADDRVLDGVRYLASTHGLNVLGSIRKPVTPERLARVLSHLDTSVLRADSHVVGADDSVTDSMLRSGLAENALQVVYLPKVSVKERELLGAEALVRWQSAQSDAIDALTLVRRLEALGLADAMTEQVLRNALLQTGQWRASGLPCGVSVNMFAALLGRLDLPEYLLGLAEEEGVAPSDITLEVDHMRMPSERDVPLEIMVRLRLLGVGLSLDNFGTGSSTLERLRFVPFTEVKVDRSFVAAACEERTARVILESSVALARRLNIQVVAQGVENQQTWELIEEMGFDAAQGYYISPPLAGKDLASWSRDWCIGRQARIAQA